LENFAEPVTLVRSPTLTKFVLGLITTGSSPLRAAARFGISGTARAGQPLHRLGDRPDVRRRGAAAAADHVDQPVRRTPR
jgi:hypothetical protein